jgi:selenocysteine-specific elongation factor
VTLSPEETRISREILSVLGEAELRPPALTAIREQLGTDKTTFDRVLRLLVRQGRVVSVGSLMFNVDAMEALKKDLLSLKAAAESAKIDVGVFKERYGVSRKYAIPLLEYLDRERVTRRVGHERILL